MRTFLMFMAATAASVLTLAATQGTAPAQEQTAPEQAGLVRIETKRMQYREAGEYLMDGVPVSAPLVEIGVDKPFSIMTRQVSRAEYLRCVEEGGCPPLDATPRRGGGEGAGEPVVGVSWIDATAYAGWLSAKTGQRYRLPTAREWALAAGSAYSDDVLAEAADPSNPAKLWIAQYRQETERAEAIDPTPMPFGSFGRNEHGLLDLGGNVWEWTDSCFVRHFTAKGNPKAATSTENCGVRVIEGRHRTYGTFFIRDPKSGGCSVGVPPANLGFRLVREEENFLDPVRRTLRGVLDRIS